MPFAATATEQEPHPASTPPVRVPSIFLNREFGLVALMRAVEFG